MNDFFLDQEILNSIEKSRKDFESKLKKSSFLAPNEIFEELINNNLESLNFKLGSSNSSLIYLDEVHIDVQSEKKNNFSKSVLGGSLVLAGQPILKKRFVMKGSSMGTSFASKYLSRIFPQTMPTRILGTKVFGRALGRAVPYVGWGLLVIDVIELIVEEIENEKEGSLEFNNGFGGGSFGGGGASSSW